MSAELSCQELVELVTAYVEGSLPRRERKRFEAHLGECEGCENYIAQMRITIEASGRLSGDSIRPEARDELLAVFRGWKTQQQG